MSQELPVVAVAGRPRPAQRALARDLPPDRRELSGDRRAGRLAQSRAHHPDDAVAGLGAQRDGGPGAAGPRLRAAHLRGPAADRTGLALLRRRADAGRRSHRQRPQGDRGAGGRRRHRRIGGLRAQRGLRHAVRTDPRRRRGADGKVEYAAQAHRVRAAGAGARAGGAGVRGRAGREPHPEPAARAAELGADRRPPISSMRASAAARSPRRAPSSTARSRRARPSSTSSPSGSCRPGLPAGRAARARSAS